MGNNGMFGFTSRPNAISAVGGTISVITISGILYKVHQFLVSATFSVITPGEMEVMMVVGGGHGANGASNRGGGAGGAGGYIYESILRIPIGDHRVTIGGNDQDTTFLFYLALAGGFATADSNGGNGGSGSGCGPAKTAGTGLVPQGKNGGTGYNSAGWQAGGGGGGYTANGGNATGITAPGAGGAGAVSSITGYSTTYAQGGTGGIYSGTLGASGAVNTGNGGNGGGGGGGTGGNGGSGIVIVRYPIGSV